MTAPKLPDESLSVSEIRYRRLFEAARDGILLLDIESLKITDANPYMTELLGYTHSEFVGKELWEIGLFRDKVANKAVFSELQESGYIRYENLPLRSNSGKRREVEFISNVYDEDGTDVIQCNIRDITDRKQAEKEVARLYEEMEIRVAERTVQLEAVNKELEAFSYSVSHDLRAPLRHINGFSLALLEDYSDKLDDTGKGYLKQVRDASIEMGSLIDDVLKLSRLSRSVKVIESVDMSEMAGAILDDLKKNDSTRSVEIDIQANLTVQGDRGFKSILLSNLLGNAWKFTSKVKNAKIHFGREMIDGESVYFVRDNGVGFDMEYADKLFGAFQRLHTAVEFEGTGIGLATVQRVVGRHGGRVWAEGAVDKGATFYFTLPDAGELINGK
jgi:PAS domain S-box-containing protein